MNFAMLRGQEHQRIGAIELVAEEASAIALCRGGAPKTYSHTDPNEDAVLFARGEGGTLIAVADGHSGDWGAEQALDYLLQDRADAWTAAEPVCHGKENWCEAAHLAIEGTNAAVLAGARELGLPAAHTTLSFALVRPSEGLLLHGSVGDSHVFRVRGGEVEDIGWAALGRSRSFYLGYPPELRDHEKARVACESLKDTRALVLATDGVSEPGIGLADPPGSVAQILESAAGSATQLQPAEVCRGLVEAALGAQRAQRAGDNIACAVWLAGL